MQTDIYDGGTSSFFQTYRWHSNSNKIPFWLWSNTKHLYFRCFFGLRFWVGIYLWVTPQNSDLSFNYLYGYVASDLKLSDYPKDTRNIIPLEASDNSLGNLIELSDDKKWITFKRNGRVRFNGCLSIYWNNDFYLQVSVCRESDDSKGTPVPVVGVSITCPLKQDNAFVYVDRVLRVKEGERLCFAFIIPNWCDTTGGFINRNSDRTSSGLMANYVSFNDEKYAWNNNFIKKILQTLSLLVP